MFKSMASIAISSVPNRGRKSQEQWFAMLFPLFTITALGIDSVYFRDIYFDGRQLANALVISYFGFMFWASGRQLRKLMLVMVPLSYIGELLFCKLLGMYVYRGVSIPLYVPLGHAIVYASGYILASTNFAKENYKLLAKAFAVTFGAIFVLAGCFLYDIFTLIFGILFFVLLRRKRWDNLYYFIGFCVIFIELIGTFFKCWTWQPKIFGMIPAANPPMGAVFLYAGGDVLLAKIVSLIKTKKAV